MLTVYIRDGTRYDEIPLSYDAMMEILKDDSIIKPDDFIEFQYPNGDKAAIRKSDVSSVYEE